MNIKNNNSQVNFGAKLLIPVLHKPFNKVINVEEVKTTFEKTTKNWTKDLEIADIGGGLGYCAYLKEPFGDVISNLSFKKIRSEETLVDKLVRTYKMLVTKKALDKAYGDAEEVKHFADRLNKLASYDDDLNKYVAEQIRYLREDGYQI